MIQTWIVLPFLSSPSIKYLLSDLICRLKEEELKNECSRIEAYLKVVKSPCIASKDISTFLFIHSAGEKFYKSPKVIIIDPTTNISPIDFSSHFANENAVKLEVCNV